MANLMKAGAEALAKAFRDFVSEPVTIKDGAQQTDGVLATVSKSFFEDDEGGSGILNRWETCDFLIHAADYKIAGVVTLPKEGHQIIRTVGGVTVTYEVGNHRDRPVWRYQDNFRVRLRVHTKQVS